MTRTNDQDAEYWRKQLDFLQTALVTANENGLFKEDPDTYNKILDYIINGFRSVSTNTPNVIDAIENFCNGNRVFNQAFNSASRWWRFKYEYGGPIALYLTVFFIGWIFFSPNFIEANIHFVPSWAFSWGLIGGILQGFWWLCEGLWKRSLRKCYYIWFFLTPLTGAILGTLAYLLFHGGFITVSGEVKPQSELFPMLLSALAGFSSRQVIGGLTKLVEKIFK